MHTHAHACARTTRGTTRKPRHRPRHRSRKWSAGNSVKAINNRSGRAGRASASPSTQHNACSNTQAQACVNADARIRPSAQGYPHGHDVCGPTKLQTKIPVPSRTCGPVTQFGGNSRVGISSPIWLRRSASCRASAGAHTCKCQGCAIRSCWVQEASTPTPRGAIHHAGGRAATQIL